MAEYKVVFEIQLDAKNPLDAAKKAQDLVKEIGENFQWYVQKDGEKELFSVDLNENDEDAVLPVKEYVPLIDNE